jgi:hypothetical protein
MNKIIYIAYFIAIILIIAEGCRKPYLPLAVSSAGSYLVVEGVIYIGSDSTIIKLSRTVPLSGKTTSTPELNAQVTVVGSNNITYPLIGIGNGRYAAAKLNLDQTLKYRLIIKTGTGSTYASDFIAVKITPPIDSIGYTVQDNGISIYANTHDPNNTTRYYRYDYEETWQFHSKYQSNFISNRKKIVRRSQAQMIYNCFGNDQSNTIVLASSAKLKQDVIYQTSITQVPAMSEKIETKYSILVKQYALTEDGYNFWQNLKKNTEQLGGIFDAQPSEISGNIHCTSNPAEPVLGYISATNVQTKRIFITNQQLPQRWTPTYPYDCELDSNLYCHYSVCQNDVALFLIPKGSAEIPIDSIPVLGFMASPIACGDCTIRGVVKQPSFWK